MNEMTSNSKIITRIIFLFIISILLAGPKVLSAQANEPDAAQPQQAVKFFSEVEIVFNDQFSPDQISTLSLAPGSDLEISDDRDRLKAQLEIAQVRTLTDAGADIKALRGFVLITPSTVAANDSDGGLTVNPISADLYVYGQNNSNVTIPGDGSWTYSDIGITSAPSAATVTSVDVHYEIEGSWTGFVYADLTDSDYQNYEYRLVDGDTDFINGTETNITAFNGRPVNQTWILWACELYSSTGGYIDSWWIKVYYDDGSPSDEYCDATGGSDEHISRVEVGNIDNSSANDSYADYTVISTEMQISQNYDITVTNGAPYEGKDLCGIWVDWNQDKDFDDTSETISVTGNPGDGPYSATITPPADANLGETRMRIRIAYDQTPSPCGNTSYGEVEDYTINVTTGVQTLKVSGYVTLSDESPLPGVLLEAYYGPFTPSGLTDISDVNGYYEITLDSPWTGHIKASKNNYGFGWSTTFTDVTTDQIENFSAYYAYSGGFGISGSPYLIETPQDMNAIGANPQDWDKYFKLIADIDMSDYTGTQYSIIGSYSDPFRGIFDGNNHTISNFTYKSTDTFNVGLFGVVGDKDLQTEIKNLTIVDPNIDAGQGGDVGILVGFCYKSVTLSDCRVIGGTVTAIGGVGGLLGSSMYGNYIRCSSSADVTATSTTEFSHAGGLIGINDFGIVTQCFSTGTVTGNDVVGGLVGNTSTNAQITNCYSKSTVIGQGYVGGLVGFNAAPITNCYAVGSVSGTGDHVNGLIGAAAGGPIINSFWDVNTTGQSTPGIGIGLTTLDMQTEDTFTTSGWDFTNIWKICEGTNYPKLAWQTSLPGDLICPDGVDMKDYAALANQWQLNILSADIAIGQGDGVIDFSDWATFANAWQGTSSPQSANWNPKCDIAPPEGDGEINTDDLSVFVTQWLQPSAYNADIAPAGGDGTVNIRDFAILANNWLSEE